MENGKRIERVWKEYGKRERERIKRECKEKEN